MSAIRPVNHVLNQGARHIRTHPGAATTTTLGNGVDGVVVAYQADNLDPTTHLGRSVVITGPARPVTDPGDLARYQRMHPGIDVPLNQAIRINTDLGTGFTLAAHTAPPPGARNR